MSSYQPFGWPTHKARARGRRARHRAMIRAQRTPQTPQKVQAVEYDEMPGAAISLERVQR